MVSPGFEKAIRRLLPLMAAILVAAAYAATLPLALWHPDSLNYLGRGVLWAHGGFALPMCDLLSYVGWIGSIALLPAAGAAHVDLWRLVWGIKMLGIAYVAACSIGTYLTARRLFKSDALACVVTALFALNPVVWLSAQAALSDMPALAPMIAAFFFFVRFYQERRTADLILASMLSGLAIVFRVQAIIILVPQLVGAGLIALEGQGVARADRLKTAMKLWAALGVFPCLSFLAVFGAPWRVESNTPLSPPDVAYVLVAVKTYFARDVGWLWGLLAWSGLTLGLYRKSTRPIALMLTAYLAASLTYFLPSHAWTAPETARYLIPSVPFTLLGIGFVWSAARGRRAVQGAVVVLAITYVASVFAGLCSPVASTAKEPSIMSKVFLLQNYLAAGAAGGYVEAFPEMATGLAMGAVLPEGSVVIMPEEGTLMERYMSLDQGGRHRTVIRLRHGAPSTQQLQAIAALPADTKVFAFPGADNAQIQSVLAKNGLVPSGRVGGATLFLTKK